jgi:cobalt-zinc-cadmium resistance protein CzcA
LTGFALVGGIAALWLRHLNLNLSASAEFITLFGVAVLNGVVLVAYINQLREQGRPLEEAMRLRLPSGSRRIRLLGAECAGHPP